MISEYASIQYLLRYSWEYIHETTDSSIHQIKHCRNLFITLYCEISLTWYTKYKTRTASCGIHSQRMKAAQQNKLANRLFNPQYLRPPLLRSLLALIASIKGHRTVMVSAEVIKILDLVKTDDPVLASEGFLE